MGRFTNEEMINAVKALAEFGDFFKVPKTDEVVELERKANAGEPFTEEDEKTLKVESCKQFLAARTAGTVPLNDPAMDIIVIEATKIVEAAKKP